MITTKFFIDEKFKDTIKKNSCRLRQKSSVQVSCFIINKAKEPVQLQNEKENKEYLNKNKTIERNKTHKNKILNFIKSKNNKKNEIKEETTIEDNEKLFKKKISEENISSIKQRIISKLKELKIENLDKVVKNENENINNEINKENKKNEIGTSTDILVNRKKEFYGEGNIRNVVYRNRKPNINNINNLGDKNEYCHNNATNTMNIDKSNINERKGICSLKNIFPKNENNYFVTGRYSTNIYMNKNLKKENSKKINGISNIEKINEISKENNSDENNIITENNNDQNNINNKNKNKGKILSKKNTNKIKTRYFTNKKEIKKDEIVDNKKENKDNKENIKNIYKNKTIKDDKNNNNENKNNANNNDVILVNKKEYFFNRRYKYKFIKKKEKEEKRKNYNDDIQRNIVLNKTATKPEKKSTYYKELITKRFSANNIKKLQDIQTSIKLSSTKSPSEYESEYYLDTLDEQNEYNKNYSHLSTEKPKIVSKTKCFRNLLINTRYNNKDFNSYTNEEERNNLFNNYLNNMKKEQTESNIDKNNYNYLSNNIKINNRDKESDKINKNNNNKYNYDYVKKIINDAIQLNNSIDIQSLFSILIINFNNKYIYTFDYKDFPKNIPQFSECYKYYAIMTIPLIFLHKDEYAYKRNSSEAKIIFEKFIYLTVDIIGQEKIAFKKIDSFIGEYKKINNYNNKENINMEECCLELINLIFRNYKIYSPLKKATEQLISFAKNESLDKVINIINDTILYCFNHKQKNSFFLIPGNKKNNFYKLNNLSEKDINNNISTPKTPFIRCAMKKNFCLVLDIDETIVHSMNLPFGNYFLLRPGVINFLEELSKLYEIIIFTCSPKIYADGILNKIDIDNNFISHRLYKDHVIFEKGKSVKKLNMIGRDLNKIIFVDNMKSNAKYNLQNLCHVSTWIYDIYDDEIIKLKIKLKNIATNNKYKDDIRKGLENCI